MAIASDCRWGRSRRVYVPNPGAGIETVMTGDRVAARSSLQPHGRDQCPQEAASMFPGWARMPDSSDGNRAGISPFAKPAHPIAVRPILSRPTRLPGGGFGGRLYEDRTRDDGSGFSLNRAQRAASARCRRSASNHSSRSCSRQSNLRPTLTASDPGASPRCLCV